ncbi:hypothetical protein N0V90_011061 [Kalmusia sp. IMI 367209]|nr:hypothetical protein N0V90_011061 [Kalmusia sp. IMI 367209]
MLMANAHGIPIQQQHGEIDDNVPAYNSRLLAQQLFLSGTNSSYNEVAGQNHWWDTVMTTPQLVEFYYTHTRNNDTIPRRLEEFEFVVGDPGDTGSKAGIKVLLLEDPGQYGRLKVKGHVIATSNVLSLEFDPAIWGTEELTIDGSDITRDQGTTAITISKSSGGWAVVPLSEDSQKRRGRQLGSMTAILRTKGPFIIRHLGAITTTHLAVQISRNLHQYFQADSEILSSKSWSSIENNSSNVITLALGDNTPLGMLSDFPVRPSASGISVHDSRGAQHQFGQEGASIGATFLRPLQGERLELIVWGTDEEALAQAARLVPMVTGVGQPDFVVLNEKAKWKGVDGALAMGFFDSDWKVTASSVVS